VEHFGVFGALLAINGSKSGSEFGRGELFVWGAMRCSRVPCACSSTCLFPFFVRSHTHLWLAKRDQVNERMRWRDAAAKVIIIAMRGSRVSKT
jgi:hypothetical protein